jgi:hypothetical protein
METGALPAKVLPNPTILPQACSGQRGRPFLP